MVLIQGAEIGGVAPFDVRIAGERIAEVGRSLARRGGERVLAAAGAALLPGLHDHHLHLLALAAALRSVACGPPLVRTEGALVRALRGASPDGEWIRGTGYFESVAGALGREQLDAMVPDRPVRIQHRSGALWILNSAAIERIGLEQGVDAPGVERDARGRATGRLFRLDAFLRERMGDTTPPALGEVGRRLARYGVTGVTDATPESGAAELAALTAAASRGALPQRILVMGGLSLPQPSHRRVARGAVKLHLAEAALPDFDETAQLVKRAHEAGRGVAIHCVTRVELVFAAAALEAAGARDGDRIEHAAVAPPDVVALLARLGVRVVGNPGFLRERGDDYLAHVDAEDLEWLHRGRGLLAAGIALAGGTDAPFGDPDPWRSMRAAVERRTEAGAVLGSGERLSPEASLGLFLSPAAAPGAPPRRIAAGEAADLCLLDRPWRDARTLLSADTVVATLAAGSVVWERA